MYNPFTSFTQYKYHIHPSSEHLARIKLQLSTSPKELPRIIVSKYLRWRWGESLEELHGLGLGMSAGRLEIEDSQQKFQPVFFRRVLISQIEYNWLYLWGMFHPRKWKYLIKRLLLFREKKSEQKM